MTKAIIAGTDYAGDGLPESRLGARRFTSAEQAGIRHLAQSPQLGVFIGVTEPSIHSPGQPLYHFHRRTVGWSVVRQAARDSREAANMWRCVTCDRLMPYFLKRCKTCKGAS